MKNSVLKKYYPKTYKVEEENGKEVVTSYTDVIEEYDLLRNEVTIIDGQGFGMYRVGGNDAEEFLDRLATKDIQYLNIGNISECLMLNENAEIVGSVFILKNDEDFIVLTPGESANEVYNWLTEQADDGIEITDMLVDNTLIFLEGPKSWRMIKKVLAMEIEIMPLRGFSEIEWNDFNITVARIGRSGEYGYAVFAEHEIMQRIVADCLEKDEEMKCSFCGRDALEMGMIEIRQPNFRYENAKEGNIIELAQHWLIQYDKEDFIGREKVMEIFEEERKCSVVGFSCMDKKDIVNNGTEIYLEDETVGKVLYNFYNPNMDHILGLALIKDELAVSGITLSINDSNKMVEIQLLSSPYVRPISWEQKME